MNYIYDQDPKFCSKLSVKTCDTQLSSFFTYAAN